MSELPDEAELERLGLYDPRAPDAEDRLKLLRYVFGLGATTDEAVRANRIFGLGSLALDLAMRPSGDTVDLDVFEQKSGLDPARVRRIWRALGLPDAGPIPIAVTPDMAGALFTVAAMSEMLSDDADLDVARVLGSSAARVAEALTGAMRVGVELPQQVAGTAYSDTVEGYASAARDLLPLFMDAFTAVFRRHLVRVSYELWSTDEDRATVTLLRTVGFADLVGSTEVLRGASLSTMAKSVRRFEEQVWELVAKAGGRVVKLIGDEAMFVVDDPARACRLALDLVDQSPQPVRVGLAHGDVVGLFGDFYGETVNLAARLVAVAEPSTAVVSETVRGLAAHGFVFDALPPQTLKGFAEPVPAYRLARHT